MTFRFRIVVGLVHKSSIRFGRAQEISQVNEDTSDLRCFQIGIVEKKVWTHRHFEFYNYNLQLTHT